MSLINEVRIEIAPGRIADPLSGIDALLLRIEKLAGTASKDDLERLAWRLTRTTEGVLAAARSTGTMHRRVA